MEREDKKVADLCHVTPVKKALRRNHPHTQSLKTWSRGDRLRLTYSDRTVWGVEALIDDTYGSEAPL